MAERRTHPNGGVYERGPDGQWHLVSQSPAMGPAIGNDPRIPGQLQAQQLQAQRTQQEIAKNPLDVASTQQSIAASQNSVRQTQIGNVQELRKEFNNLPEVKNYSEVLQALGGALRAPKGPQGDLAVIYAFAKAMDPGSVVREGEMDMANSTASVIAQLKQKYKGFAQGHGLPPEVRLGLIEAARAKGRALNEAYALQYRRYRDQAQSLGANPIAVVGNHLGDAFRPMEQDYVRRHNSKGVAPVTEEPTGKTKVIDPMQGMEPGGPPPLEVDVVGGRQPTPEEIEANPELYADWKRLNEREGGNITAGVAGLVDTATFGFGDEIAAAGDALQGSLAGQGSLSDLYRRNLAVEEAYKQRQSQDNPGAYLGGQALGGVGAGLGLAGAASRVPGLRGGIMGMPNLLSKEGLAGDATYSALYGAGSNSADRGQGAIDALKVGVPAGIAARGAISGAANALSPSGGDLRVLYDMGVRPSIGQRFGGILNSGEEKLQSIPIVGDAIAGTRQRARDQFQVGLFNDSLGEIGLTLPKGMKPGNEPHAFAQSAFSKAYDDAERGMSAVADGQFTTDLGNVQRTVSGLREDSKKQFTKLFQDAVSRRFNAGALAGDAYKDAMSEMAKKAAKIRSNPTGDSELADAIDEAMGAIRASAVRNSPAEAVAKLDATDKGYAKLVRIEDAARRRGGEAGTFNPTQYDAAVQGTSGGVRSRGYLSGDALNSDLAKAGLRLRDEVPNSASWDRAAWAGGVGGLAYLEPQSLIGLGALGALNAPGARNAVTGAMAPREAVNIGNMSIDLAGAAKKLRKRAPYGGMFGAPIALSYYGQ